MKMYRQFIVVLYTFLMVFHLSAQTDRQIEREWSKEIQKSTYGKDKEFRNNDWSSNTPANGNNFEESTVDESETDPIQSILKQQIEDQKVKSKKQKHIPAKEIVIPDFNPPDIDEPDVDIDPVDVGKIPQSVWQLVLFLLIFAVIILIVYFVLRNLNPNSSIATEFDDYWNPEVVTKSELELRLEAALQREDFREAVRVYFTMILQELIRVNEIKWKREKTNHQYLLEVKSTILKSNFSKSLRLFEIVWYGEYTIDATRYKEMEPVFVSFLKTLKNQAIE